MGLYLGIAICLLAGPVWVVYAFESTDFETGLPTKSPWYALGHATVPLLVGGLVIFSHYHPIGW